MSESDEWTDWHLTPRGWEEGSQKLDFVGYQEKPVPKDGVMTCRYSEKLSSPFSKSKNDGEIKKLLEK